MVATFLDAKGALEILDNDAQPIDTATYALVGGVYRYESESLAMASLPVFFVYFAENIDVQLLDLVSEFELASAAGMHQERHFFLLNGQFNIAQKCDENVQNVTI